MMKKSVNIDMTNGPFLKKIIRFAVPLVLTGLLQLVYNTADTVIVGRFAGKESLAAVGATGSLINLIVNVFMGLSMGAGIMQARHIGAGDAKSRFCCTHTSMALSAVCGVIVAVIGFFLSRTFLELMDSPTDVIDLSELYLKIYFLGSPGSLIFNFGASLIRAQGDTKRPLAVLSFAGTVNIILNLILVIPIKLGVAGVAVATVVSQYISAALIVLILVRQEDEGKLCLKKIRIYKKELRSIILIGLPAGIQNSLFSVSNVIVQSTVNSFGSAAMAGIAAGSNLDGYIYTATNAVAQTGMTFTSQNIGAARLYNIGKIFRRCLTLAAAVGIVCTTAGYIFRYELVSIFSSDASVIEIGAQRLEMIMPFYVFCSLMDVAACQIRGMGHSFEPMIISVFGACGLRLLWIFVALPYNYTLMNLYWAYPISWTATFMALLIAYAFVKRAVCKSAVSRQDEADAVKNQGS